VKISGMSPHEDLPPEVVPRAYLNQPVWKRIVVILAGPMVNIVLAFLILFVLSFGVQDPTAIQVGSIEEETPAARTLQEGDRFVAVNGVRVNPDNIGASAERIVNEVDASDCRNPQAPTCKPVTIVVERDGQEVELQVTPFYDAERKRERLGFSFAEGGYVDAGFNAPEAAEYSLDFMWFVSTRTVDVIVNIFDPEKRKEISGVVGSYETTRQSIDLGAREAFTLLAVISLSLGLINLFPFLPLDGGHIFWAIVEKVRGKPVTLRVMERAGVVGFMLVILLFLVGLSNDIDRLTGEGFDVR
jgi:regulator of sigma E protease